jgi:hypothetical protein
MGAEVAAIILQLIPFAWAIFQEYLKAKDKQRIEKEAFDKRELEFGVLAQKALVKWQADAAAAAQASQGGQDWLDSGGGGKTPPK